MKKVQSFPNLLYNRRGDIMQRIIMLRRLTEEDRLKLDSLLMNEEFEYEISTISKSLTIHGNNDVLAYVKRILVNNGFEIL